MSSFLHLQWSWYRFDVADAFPHKTRTKNVTCSSRTISTRSASIASATSITSLSHRFPNDERPDFPLPPPPPTLPPVPAAASVAAEALDGRCKSSPISSASGQGMDYMWLEGFKTERERENTGWVR